MKTYQLLNENDILQKGDEFLSALLPPAWTLATQIGEKASGILYRRPVVEKQYRILEQAEASLPTDEGWSPDHGWVVGSYHNTNVRRRQVKSIDWKEDEKHRVVGDSIVFKGLTQHEALLNKILEGDVHSRMKANYESISKAQREALDAATSAGLDSNRTELLSQSSDLKCRLENALSDKILLHANLSDRNAAIVRLKERLEDHVAIIEDKNATIRRLSEKLENIDAPIVEHVKSLEATVEQLKEHRKMQEEEFEVVVKTLLADTQFYRRVIDKLTQDVQEL